jgi:DNA polymerase-3 subunit epsilon
VETAHVSVPASSDPIIRSYLRAFDASWTDETPASEVRFVALDTETTGPDPKRDRVITIGAVGIRDGEIDLADSFEAMLKVAHNQAAVTVHGVTRDEASGGMEEHDALRQLLDYLRDGVIVGHHIGFDIEVLAHACQRHFQISLANRWLDTMDLTLHLQDSGAFESGRAPAGFSLDALCDFFGVEPRDRHTAGGDAFITALIFLRLQRLARHRGRQTLAELAVPYPVGRET